MEVGTSTGDPDLLDWSQIAIGQEPHGLRQSLELPARLDDPAIAQQLQTNSQAGDCHLQLLEVLLCGSGMSKLHTKFCTLLIEYGNAWSGVSRGVRYSASKFSGHPAPRNVLEGQTTPL